MNIFVGEDAGCVTDGVGSVRCAENDRGRGKAVKTSRKGWKRERAWCSVSRSWTEVNQQTFCIWTLDEY